MVGPVLPVHVLDLRIFYSLLAKPVQFSTGVGRGPHWTQASHPRRRCWHVDGSIVLACRTRFGALYSDTIHVGQ